MHRFFYGRRKYNAKLIFHRLERMEKPVHQHAPFSAPMDLALVQGLLMQMVVHHGACVFLINPCVQRTKLNVEAKQNYLIGKLEIIIF